MDTHFPPLQERVGQRTARQGERIYSSAESGCPWRLVSGSVRLDRSENGSCEFSGIAIAGDVIGAETLIFGQYNFSATALLPCTLSAWPGNAENLAEEVLLRTLASAERRAAEVIALRGGLAMERVRRLLSLLTPSGSDDRRLPGLRDMADITALRLETVSRTLRTLRATGIAHAQRASTKARNFQLSANPGKHSTS